MRTRIRLAAAPLALLLLPLLASLSIADEGMGTAQPGARVEQLDLGEHWYGAPVTLDDLKGKVVLVEMWGS